MTTVVEQPTQISRPVVGEYRRFGEVGVVYEVIEVGATDQAVVRVVETGETLPYPITSILSDPLA